MWLPHNWRAREDRTWSGRFLGLSNHERLNYENLSFNAFLVVLDTAIAAIPGTPNDPAEDLTQVDVRFSSMA